MQVTDVTPSRCTLIVVWFCVCFCVCVCSIMRVSLWDIHLRCLMKPRPSMASEFLTERLVTKWSFSKRPKAVDKSFSTICWHIVDHLQASHKQSELRGLPLTTAKAAVWLPDSDTPEFRVLKSQQCVDPDSRTWSWVAIHHGKCTFDRSENAAEVH